jgi:N utilization substance protein A
MMKERNCFAKRKQIPSDFFRKGDNVRGIIERELKGNKPQIINVKNSEKFWKII